MRNTVHPEVELTTSKAQLNELFDQAPEGIVLLDLQDRVLRINPEFIRMFGYSEQEAIGRSVNDLIAPDELRSEAETYTQRITHGEPVSAETVRRRKDGQRIPVSLLAVPVSIPGEQIAEYAIYRDISERKRLEDLVMTLVTSLNTWRHETFRPDFLSEVWQALGAGRSATPYALLMSGVTSEVVLRDRDLSHSEQARASWKLTLTRSSLRARTNISARTESVEVCLPST